MKIEGIFIAPFASEPMQSHQHAILIKGKGLEGDRYCNHDGTYSVLRMSKLNPGEREPGRQLTIISGDSVEKALDQKGIKRPNSLGDLRRNIVLRGLDSHLLFESIGRVAKLGPECRIQIVRHCVPCMYNERKNGIPGLMEAIWNDAGFSCKVLVGGSIKVGDEFEILSSSEARENIVVDDGNQVPGYYIPPSKRTTAMVFGAKDRLREEKNKLEKIDPEGVERVQRSYASVGLQFWPNEK